MKQHYSTALAALLLFIGPPFRLSAQTAHQYEFVKTLPGRPVSMAVDPHRNTYVSFPGNTVIQYDTRGAVRWQQTFANLPEIVELATDGAGNLIIAGTARSGTFIVGDSTYKWEFPGGGYALDKGMIVKLDSAHKLRWARVVSLGR